MENLFNKKNANILFVVLSFSFSIFLFAPLQIYLTNRLFFPLVFLKTFYYFIAIAIFATILIALLFIILSLIGVNFGKHKAVISVLFAITFLMWLQGNILLWDYGVFDGKGMPEGMPWGKYYKESLIDIGTWVLFIAIGIIKSEFIYKILPKASAGLITIQLVSTVFIMAESQILPSAEKYSINIDKLFEFSSKQNVIILLLDSFQGDVFQEIIDRDPEYKDMFKGFTYFRDSLAGFGSTHPSPTLILTGQYYDNTIPLQEFMKKEFLANSIPKALKDNGFKTELYSFYFNASVYSDDTIWSNLGSKKDPLRVEDIAFIYDIALFRYMPHPFKKYIYHNERWFLKNIISHYPLKKYFIRSKSFNSTYKPLTKSIQNFSNYGGNAFLKDISSQVRLCNDRSTFKYIHIQGMHPPLEFNEKIEHESLPHNREGYIKQAKGLLKLVGLFLNKLEKSNAYDNSMIFIIGDHGSLKDIYLPKDKHAKSKQSDNIVNPSLLPRASPLILVKPFKSKDEMCISDAPVSLSDIPQTIDSEIGLKDDFPGISMFVVRESDNRKRRFFAHRREKGQAEGYFMPPMTEHIVSGFSLFRGSWSESGRKLNPPKGPIYQPNLFLYRIKRLLTEQ